MESLDRILERATSAILPGYFQLQIDGGDPIYRERVYCYELYHQMRSRWPEDTEYYLNGEIDKAAHPILMQLGAAGAKPDLLVHRPGYMIGNHAIIEVKASNPSNDAIRTDLTKLTLFLNKVGYARAIYLIYGWGADSSVVKQIVAVAEGMPELARIEVWLHQAPGDAAQCVATTLAVQSDAADLKRSLTHFNKHAPPGFGVR